MIYMSIELGLALRPVINKTLDVRQSGSVSSRDSIIPARGLLRYEHDSPTTKWVYFDGTAWQPFEEALFASSASTDYVQHAVGDIAVGTTVADLQQRSITQILTQLLRIGPAPEIILTASGISLAYANGNQEFEVGSDASVTLTLILNTGRWTGGDMVFAPVLGPIHGTPSWGNINLSITAETATSVTMTSDAPFTHTFTSLQDVRLPTTGSIQVQAGPTYQNNYGNQYKAEPRNYTSISNAPTLRGYLPFYKDDLAMPQRVYQDTPYVEITSHESDEVVEVPFVVSQVQQYESFGSGSPWRVLSGDDYTVQPSKRIFGDIEIDYYRVALTFTRGARDIRIQRQF